MRDCSGHRAGPRCGPERAACASGLGMEKEEKEEEEHEDEDEQEHRAGRAAPYAWRANHTINKQSRTVHAALSGTMLTGRSASIQSHPRISLDLTEIVANREFPSLPRYIWNS